MLFLTDSVLASPPVMDDVRILFCSCGPPGSTTYSSLNPQGGFDENSTLQPWSDWYRATGLNATTAKQMIIDGWTLHSIQTRGFSSGLDQLYVVFVHYAPDAAPPPPADPQALERVRSK